MAFHKYIIVACLLIAIGLNAVLACVGIKECGLWLPLEAVAAIGGASSMFIIVAIILVLRAVTRRVIEPYMSGADLIGIEFEKASRGKKGKGGETAEKKAKGEKAAQKAAAEAETISPEPAAPEPKIKAAMKSLAKEEQMEKPVAEATPTEANKIKLTQEYPEEKKQAEFQTGQVGTVKGLKKAAAEWEEKAIAKNRENPAAAPASALAEDDKKDVEAIVASLEQHKADYTKADVKKEVVDKGYSKDVAEEVARRLYGIKG